MACVPDADCDVFHGGDSTYAGLLRQVRSATVRTAGRLRLACRIRRADGRDWRLLLPAHRQAHVLRRAARPYTYHGAAGHEFGARRQRLWPAGARPHAATADGRLRLRYYAQPAMSTTHIVLLLL